MSAGVLALEGVKVVEFGGYAAGPHVGKMLANFGATVVHVESMSRPDGFRMQYPPYKDGKPGINSGGCFTYFNDSKYGVTVDLKNPEGRRLAKQLANWGDIVIENMRPGVIDRVGLGYEELRQSNPDPSRRSRNQRGCLVLPAQISRFWTVATYFPHFASTISSNFVVASMTDLVGGVRHSQ